MRYLVYMALLAGLAVPAGAVEHPCGPDAPCKTASGIYHLAFPDDWDGKTRLPAVMYFHGHNSSGRAAITNRSLFKKFTARGYLLITPTGTAGNGRTALGWPANRRTKGRRDDIAFVSEVIADVQNRLPLQRDKILVTGFSSGGSMVWHLACYGFDRFAAYASVAGGLRRPLPDERCPGGPFRMLHIHGFSDAQVPLEGRGIGNWHQGDVFEGLSVLRKTNGCRSNPVDFSVSRQFQCRRWNGCRSSATVQFCLHPRGHMLPRGWSEKILAWFEAG